VVQAAAGSAGMAVTGITFGPQPPAAPTLTLTSANTDTTPDFTLSGDLVVGDTVRFQYSTSSGFAGASELTNTIDAAEDTANLITFTTGALALGTWYFRARIERPVNGNSGWSNTVTDTIISSGSTMTWNPADGGAPNIVLSGGDLVATMSASATTRACRATGGQSTGKWYWEVVLTTEASGGGNMCAGISYTGMAGNLIGFGTDTIAILNQNAVFRNSSSLGAATGDWSNGENVSFALDLTNKKLHIRLQGGSWNGNAGDNPATNTGGFDISMFTVQAYMPGITLATTGDVMTGKFSASSWAYAAPSGFIAFP